MIIHFPGENLRPQWDVTGIVLSGSPCRAQMTVQCLMEMKYYVESLSEAVKQEQEERLASQEIESPEEETLQKEEFGHSE